MVQPERPNPCFVLKGLLLAEVTCFSVQVAPPSVEVATTSGWGNAKPWLKLRNEAQQMYTFPKKGLLAALSAQICSLSLNVVDDCLETITGAFHAFLPAVPPDAAVATSSVRETAMASKPLNVSSRL